MTQTEQDLLRALCKFRHRTWSEDLLSAATPSVLGHLFFNRMQGVAHEVLAENGQLSRVNREFRNSLTAAREQNRIKNQSYTKCLAYLMEALYPYEKRIALLKGAFLCAQYPEGCRTSNDIDILLRPKDVTEIGERLSSLGFKQGHIRGGVFEEASRYEIITSKMTRGETVPYIKEVELPFMKYLEVDLNFSLDYKNTVPDTLSVLLENSKTRKSGEIDIYTLDELDFFLHLCAHLYKEATTLPWIQMKRDMTLYKYADIYLLLSEMDAEAARRLFARALVLGLDKICAYAILETAEIFAISHHAAVALASEILTKDPDFRLTVIAPTEKKQYRYQTKNASERFFLKDRTLDLKEVVTHAEKAAHETA